MYLKSENVPLSGGAFPIFNCFNRTHAKACKSDDDDDGDMKWRNMILMMNILRPEKSASQFFWQNSIEGIKWIRSDGFWWWITKWVLYSGSMKLFPAKIAERATLQKSMTSEGNILILIVDRRPPLQTGLMNFQLIANHYESQAI